VHTEGPMNRRTNAKVQWTKLGARNLAMLIGLSPLAARAQAEAPVAPPAAPPPAVAPAPPPAEAKPPTSGEAMPATRPDTLPPIAVGAWLRAGARIQGPDPKSLDGEKMETIYGELHAGGKIHKNVSVTLNLNADGLHGSAAIEDAIIGFDIVDPLHIWIGQLLVPVDRANASGPFFMIPWNYPGFLSVGGATVVAAPAEGPNGRNGGAVVWGEFMEGTFKYLAGAFQTGGAAASPLLSGRLNLAIVGKEPGFWGNASYFGDKDVLAIGVGGQHQKNGSVVINKTPPRPNTMDPAIGAVIAVDDYSEVNADLLAEFKLGGGAWVTGEAAYYHYEGAFNPVKDHFYVLGAIASGPLGIGNLQPMVRYQWAKTQYPVPDVTTSSIDAALAYLIKGPALRVIATFSHTDLGNDVVGNALQLSAQAIFF
jgi:hypothetical protein